MPVGDIIFRILEEFLAEGEEGVAVGLVEGFEGVGCDFVESLDFAMGEFLELHYEF